MNIWLDAQLSPQIATWISEEFQFEAVAVRDIGMRDAEDREIFDAAKTADCVVLTKDRDFITLLDRFGPPPRIMWLTCGNTSNSYLEGLLKQTLANAIEFLNTGEAMVEISSS
jgi:predicted nuclease of predicted toxin-antitoxin system